MIKIIISGEVGHAKNERGIVEEMDNCLQDHNP